MNNSLDQQSRMKYKRIPIRISINPDKWIIGLELSRFGLSIRISCLSILIFWKDYQLDREEKLC